MFSISSDCVIYYWSVSMGETLLKNTHPLGVFRHTTWQPITNLISIVYNNFLNKTLMFIFNCTNVVLLPELRERFVSIVNRNISFQYNTGVIEFNILVNSNVCILVIHHSCSCIFGCPV